MGVLGLGLMAAALVVAGQTAALAAGPVCVPTGEGQLRCAIDTIADCRAIRHYPYARNLFCPAAFAAARTMVTRLAGTLGVAAPTRGFFHYYQTLADPRRPGDEPAQTTIPCLDTPAPYPGGSQFVEGAGAPLCHLAAYVTSPGPVPATGGGASGNPVPDVLRTYPEYFAHLYAPVPAFPLTEFRTGSVFDPIVDGLGATARDAFIADYPAFSPTALYDPGHWRADRRYRGISGGGGGGWGGEIAILGPRARPLVLLAWGGGGGGGITSWKPPAGPASSAGGAGGGGGMQFGNAYRFRGRSHNGLGLGAGRGSDEGQVQYSYNDYHGSGRPPRPAHEYNPAVIADYQAQLANLARQLRGRFEDGRAIVVKGGGGMGAGTEYLRPNGQEYEPHALSTQAGFQFAYVFERPGVERGAGPGLGAPMASAVEQDVYEHLGDDYRTATSQAYRDCGSDYANYACMCPRTHAIVICLVGQRIGDPDKIPGWLQQQHCPNTSTEPPGSRWTSYQRLLLDAASRVPVVGPAATPRQESPSCLDTLKEYFGGLNAPVDVRY
jgi:hypothetical protein